MMTALTSLFIQWLYFDAPRAYIRYTKEVIEAFYHYFSISLLTKTLFDPWRHDAVNITRLPVSQWGQAMVMNGFSRAIGFMMRSIVIGLGLLAIFTYMVGLTFFLIAWYTLPFLLIASMVYGLQLIAKGSL